MEKDNFGDNEQYLLAQNLVGAKDFAEFSPFPNGEDEGVIEMKPIMYKCKFGK